MWDRRTASAKSRCMSSPTAFLVECSPCGIVERKVARRLLHHDHTNISRIDGNPAEAGQESLASTVLRLAHNLATHAKPLVAEFRGRTAFFFFNDRAPPEFSSLPQHDPLPI